MKLVAEPPIDVSGQFQSGRRQRIDDRAEAGQRVDERMDCPAAFKVAGNRDLHVLDALVLRAQREKVAKCLRRMLVRAVAAIDHRYGRVFGGKPGGAVARVADNNDVGVIAGDSDGVGEALALRGGTRRGICARDLVASEPEHCALKRQARAGRRLVEQAGENVFRSDAAAAADAIGNIFVRQIFQKPRCQLENSLDLLIGEIIDGNDVARQRLRFRHQRGRICPVDRPGKPGERPMSRDAPKSC